MENNKENKTLNQNTTDTEKTKGRRLDDLIKDAEGRLQNDKPEKGPFSPEKETVDREL